MNSSSQYFKAPTVAWTRWNEAGYSLKPSKQHIADDADERTLCGRALPNVDDAYFDPDTHSGECKRCKAKYEAQQH